MATVTYVFAKQTSWRDYAWQPGDKLPKSELPDELFKTLVEDGNIVPLAEYDPPREATPPEPDAPKRKPKE
jgi:hypothetical protein